MLEQISKVASILTLLTKATNLLRRLLHKTIRIETIVEEGLITQRSGFTEPAVKITVVNESEHSIKIIDIRLMFCGQYGASVAPKAPMERFHLSLPVDLDSGTQEIWYIPAEKLSKLLSSLHRLPSTTMQTSRKVKLHARCISGTGKIFKGPTFPFSVNPNSHWH